MGELYHGILKRNNTPCQVGEMGYICTRNTYRRTITLRSCIYTEATGAELSNGEGPPSVFERIKDTPIHSTYLQLSHQLMTILNNSHSLIDHLIHNDLSTL